MQCTVEVDEKKLLEKVKIFKSGGTYVGIIPSFSKPDVNYTVVFDLASSHISCTCPHFVYRQKPCKHIGLFIKAMKEKGFT